MSLLRNLFLLSVCCAAFGCGSEGGGDPEPPADPTPAPDVNMDEDQNTAMPPE